VVARWGCIIDWNLPARGASRLGGLAKWQNWSTLRAMDPRTLARYEVRAQVFKALAHPSRLLMVDQLSQAERCVCELTELVGSDMSTVSKHLAVLKAAGVVQDERRGSQVWYSLRMKCVTRFVGCVESELQRQARQQMELVDAVIAT
jgi:DNA-binding transcriptional ArsR family regulator